MPTDIPREEYIRTSYATNSVTLINPNGEIKHQVSVGKFDMQLIRFPKDIDDLGSEVVCVSLPYSNTLRVISVFYNNDEGTAQAEGQYRLYKDGKGIAEVSVRHDGVIELTATGADDIAKININANSKNKKATINIISNGEVNIVCQGGKMKIISDQDVDISCQGGKTTVQSDTELLLQYKKEDSETKIAVTDGDITMTSEKIFLNKDEAQPVLLGNDSIDFISALLDQLGKESAGPYVLLGNPMYTQMKLKLDKLKSKKNFAN